MNQFLSAIAACERDPRAMPFIPSRTITLTNGNKACIPMVTKPLLQQAGTESLCMVAGMLDVEGMDYIETKDELIDAILDKAQSGEPMPDGVSATIIPRKATSREKQQVRAFKRSVKSQVKQLRKMRN